MTTIVDPLTTTFTAFASCSSVLSVYSSWGDMGGVLHALQNGYSPGVGTASACYPPNFYNHNMYPGDQYFVGIYSPGVCPSGYETSSLWLSSTVTTAICCPSGFSAATAIVGKCKKAALGPYTVAIGDTSSTVVRTPFLMYDWAITIAWASSDFASAAPASIPPSTPVSTPATSSSAIVMSSRTTTTASPATRSSATSKGSTARSSHLQASSAAPNTENPLHQPSTDGLSTAAKEGIGIGAGVACLLIMAALVWWLLRRRRHAREVAAKPAIDAPNAYPVLRDETSVAQHQYYPVEIDGQSRPHHSTFSKPELEDTTYEQRHRYELG